MNLKQVCEIIDLPEQVRTIVLAKAQLPEVKQAEEHKADLLDRNTWEGAVSQVSSVLGDDPDGMKMLAFMLMRAAEAHERYAALGIGDDIFADTMKFCTRFVLDHHRIHGAYAFAWWWWFPRQLSLQEFRFGALEYELIDAAAGRSISIHIPADAELTPDALRQSYLLAIASIKRIAPAFAGADMTCDSWMLSPALDTLLPANSRILAFKAAFDILSVDPTSPHATRWIFGRYDTPLDQLPEGTSLQRRAKAHMQAGGTIGAAFGTLRPALWLNSPPQI